MRRNSRNRTVGVIFIVVSALAAVLIFFPSDPESKTGTATTTDSSGQKDSPLSFKDVITGFFQSENDTSPSVPSSDESGTADGTNTSTPPSSGPRNYRGVYVVTPQITSGNPGALTADTYSLPYIDGVAIRISWEALEPSNGHYDWSKLDAVIAPTLKNGKKFSLGIGTGDNAPDWLYSEGVPSVKISQQNTSGSACTTFTEPVPWNSLYQSEYANLMKAVAQHLKSIPNAYDSLTVVKITGINETTQELNFTFAKPDPDKPSCVSDAGPIWAAAGYRPSIAIASWNSFATSVSTAFPDKVYAQVFNGNAFLPIDESGKILKKTDPIRGALLDTVLANGLSRFHSKFGGVFDALAIETFKDVGQKVYATSQKGGIAFYQTNLYGGPGLGAMCGPEQSHGSAADTRVVCTDSTYKKLLDNGLSHNGTYFEIWQVNAHQFPNAVTYLQSRLR